jgi:hypothetical protein
MIAPRIQPTGLIGISILLAALAATTVPAAQGPGRPPKRIAPSLDAVLPHLNASVVRVRTPSETQLAKSDASLEAARDGVATTHMTGLRVRDDLALILVPGTGALPSTYDVGLFDGWLPASVVASDPGRRLVLLHTSGRREPAPVLAPVATTAPGFVVTAASVGPTLDIRTVWFAPPEPVDLPAHGVVFAIDGRLIGLAAEVEGRRAIVPAAEVLTRAQALVAGAKPAQPPR